MYIKAGRIARAIDILTLTLSPASMPASPVESTVSVEKKSKSLLYNLFLCCLEVRVLAILCTSTTPPPPVGSFSQMRGRCEQWLYTGFVLARM
jgi:hypothetical protein